MSVGFSRRPIDLGQYIGLAPFVPDRRAVGFDARCRVHIAEAPLQEGNDAPIDIVDAGADFDHGGAIVGIENIVAHESAMPKRLGLAKLDVLGGPR